MARLSDGEIDERLATGAWEREGDTIVRDFELTDFKEAMALANAIGDAAEEAGHHPDILVHGYKRMRITLCTHSEGGITENDFALAATIDGLHSS